MGTIKSHGQTEVPGPQASPVSPRPVAPPDARATPRLAHYPQPGQKELAGGCGWGAHPAPPPHGTATRALHCPTSRPGLRRPRRAGAPGLPWLRDPGLGGRVINSPPRGPLAPRPRPPHWQLPPTPDPARPGPGAPTWPQFPARGRSEQAVRPGAGAGVGGWPIGVSQICRPRDLPEPSFSHPFFPRVQLWGRGGRVTLRPPESTSPARPAGAGLGSWGTERHPAPQRAQVGALRSPPAQVGGCEGGEAGAHCPPQLS